MAKIGGILLHSCADATCGMKFVVNIWVLHEVAFIQTRRAQYFIKDVRV